MRWLAFGTYDVARHPRVGVLIEGLRAAGDEVVEVNVPLALDTAARVAMLRQPWRLPILAAKLARCWALLALRSWRWRYDPRLDAVLVGYLGHFDVRLARRLFPRALIVLDHLTSAAGTAHDRGLAGGGRAGGGRAGGAKAALLRAVDAGALRSADVVVVDTWENADSLPAAAAARAVVAPVGAGGGWFTAGAARSGAARSGADERPLRVIFVGLFTPLHGTPTLGAAMAALAGDDRVELTIVGTGQEYAECRRLAAANPRARWMDWVNAADLPALVAAHDVCLGIFGTTAKAAMVVPTKIFQGAAAGCAIVTSDTPPQRAALGDSAVYVPPGDAEALANALRALAGDPANLAGFQELAAARAALWFTASAVAEPVRRRVRAADRQVRPAARTSHDEGGSVRMSNPPLAPRAALRWRLVRAIVADLAPRTILELGCGLGAVGARLARRAGYTAVEPDDTSWQVARRRIGPLGGTVIHGDHNKVPEGATYDLVCAFEVLEHIADDAAALADWFALVRPGGQLLLSVPADPARFGWLDELAGHYRRYSAEQLRQRLVEAGAVDVRVVHYGWPLGYVMDWVKDRLVRPRTPDTAHTAEERTRGSGRMLQPRGSLTGALIVAGVAPFAALQRLRPNRGPGLVALATRLR